MQEPSTQGAQCKWPSGAVADQVFLPGLALGLNDVHCLTHVLPEAGTGLHEQVRCFPASLLPGLGWAANMSHSCPA